MSTLNHIRTRQLTLADRKKLFAIVAVTPILLYMVFWVLLPMIWVFILSFFNYSVGVEGGPILGLGGNNPFVGMQNYFKLFAGQDFEGIGFRKSLGNTFVFAILVLVLNLALTLPLAVAVEAVRNPAAKTFFRFVYFLPAVTSTVAVALIWDYIYHPQRGLLNEMIKAVGGTPQIWLTNPKAAFLGTPLSMWSVIIAYLWRDFGYNLIIFIAALQGIPTSLKEAAQLDGANGWQQFWKVTIPLLRPTLLFVVVLTMISSFQVFDIIQVMTGGGPQDQSRVIMLDIYGNAFRNQRMGFASAEALVLFVIVLIVTIVQMRLLRSDPEA